VASPHVVDVTDASFPTAVLEESRKRPVIVDFWAPWCGPCRALSPVLEKLADKGEGRFLIAKVNTDDNPRFAGEFGVRGIPAVFAVKDGEVVDAFTGALPEPQVRAFLNKIAPSPGDALATGARAALLGKNDGVATRLLAELRAVAPADVRGAVGLAVVAARAGRKDEARSLLPAPSTAVPAEWTNFVAEARLLVEVDGDVDAARAAVEAAPTDVDAVLRLGGLLFAQGQTEAAFDALLAGLSHVKGARRDDLRKRLVDLFEVAGPRTPVVEAARSRLAALWFS
jgi:putative thioredoxin